MRNCLKWFLTSQYSWKILRINFLWTVQTNWTPHQFAMPLAPSSLTSRDILSLYAWELGLELHDPPPCGSAAPPPAWWLPSVFQESDDCDGVFWKLRPTSVLEKARKHGLRYLHLRVYQCTIEMVIIMHAKKRLRRIRYARGYRAQQSSLLFVFVRLSSLTMHEAYYLFPFDRRNKQ